MSSEIDSVRVPWVPTTWITNAIGKALDKNEYNLVAKIGMALDAYANSRALVERRGNDGYVVGDPLFDRTIEDCKERADQLQRLVVAVTG